jgi:hypothetical protein
VKRISALRAGKALAFEEFGGLALDDSEGGGEGVGFGFAEDEMDVFGIRT